MPRIEISAGIAQVVLDDPPQNRIRRAALAELAAALERIGNDDAARVLLLRAEGPNFSVGADLSDPELAGAVVGGPDAAAELARTGQALIEALCDLPVPTVCAARGHVIGAGACLFFGCDFRFAEASARVAFPEVSRGMHLSWGIVPRLVSELGAPRARRLALAGETLPVADLSDAVRVVDDADGEARALSRSLSEKPAPAVRAIKQTLVRCTRSDAAHDDPEQFAATVGSPEFAEAMQRFFSGG